MEEKNLLKSLQRLGVMGCYIVVATALLSSDTWVKSL